MKIPQNDKRIVVSNGINSIEGLISYTKNIDLDEKGYIKLSAPMCKIYSSEAAEGGDVDLDTPIDIFSYDDGEYKVITNDRAFNFSLGGLSFTEDTGYTGWTNKTRVVNWVGDNWHIGGGEVYSYTGATGTTVYTQVINKLLSYIELFVNKNTLVGAFGDNVLWQYNTSYANTTNLTLPANLVITGAAYSNNLMGVITRQGKNQGNAYFFTWDGGDTSADSGYPVNDSFITAISAYKSSWVLTTTAGQLLYFNGGGFEELGSLPTFIFEDDLLSLGVNQSSTPGNIIHVDGDTIHVNCASLPEFASNRKPYRPGFSGGVFCYDPSASFYHKFAPSYSKYAPENGTASSDVITLTTHYMETGDEVWLKTDDQGLTGGRTYFAIVLSPTTIKLADTYDDALNNVSVSITDGTLNNLFYVKRTDYGVESVRFTDLGLVKKLRDYNGFNESGVMPTFLGAQIHPNTVASSRVSVLNAAVPVMSNRGYVITSKFQTDGFTDNWKGVAIKYSKLSPQSSIVVKGKTKDQEAVIVGDMTLVDATYTGPSITWDANGIQFTTTSDLSTVEVGDEVHIFDGAGAGQSAHVSTIEAVGSSYTVILDEKIRGITSNVKSCVSIDKWVKLGVITASDTDGYKYLSLMEPSPTFEIKLELRGIGVKISDIIPINENFKSSTV